MTSVEMMALNAKVKFANAYIQAVIERDGKIDPNEVYRVVTREMRKHVIIVGREIAEADGLGYVRIKGVA